MTLIVHAAAGPCCTSSRDLGDERRRRRCRPVRKRGCAGTRGRARGDRARTGNAQPAPEFCGRETLLRRDPAFCFACPTWCALIAVKERTTSSACESFVLDICFSVRTRTNSILCRILSRNEILKKNVAPRTHGAVPKVPQSELLLQRARRLLRRAHEQMTSSAYHWP